LYDPVLLIIYQNFWQLRGLELARKKFGDVILRSHKSSHSNDKIINCWSNSHVGKYLANSRLWRHLLPSPLSPPSRLLSPPSSSVLRVHSSLVWRCIDNTPLFFFFWYSHSIQDFITSVLMSRRERRLTKWSYQTNSVGTNSWFWQQHLCHLH